MEKRSENCCNCSKNTRAPDPSRSAKYRTWAADPAGGSHSLCHYTTWTVNTERQKANEDTFFGKEEGSEKSRKTAANQTRDR